MTRNLTLAITTTLVLLTVSTASAQDYINISVTHSGEDVVGTRLAYEVREQLRASTRYDLNDDARIAIYMVTIPMDDDNKTVASVASVVFLAKGTSGEYYYLQHLVLTIGSKRTSEQASAILAKLDQTIDGWRQAYNASKR